MTINVDELDEVIEASEKRYKVSFHKASQYPHVLRIPFSSPELNMATGGGIPMGQISRLWGEESSGKSLTSLLIAANAQRINLFAEQLLESKYDLVKAKGQEILDQFPDGMKVCWYDAEGSFDKAFAKTLGVDIDELEILPDRRIEVIGSVLEAALGSAHLHIIDSTAGGVSVDELKANVEDWQRGLKARVWNKVVDRFQARMDRRDNAIVFIDQVRIDQRTGGYMIPGGRKMRHESSLTIQLKRGQWLYRAGDKWKDEAPQTADTVTGKAEADGVEFNAHVEKNRKGTQGRRALMRYEYKTRSFDNEFELAKAAEYLGVTEKSGNWFVLPDGLEVDGKDKVNGIGQFQNAIKEFPQLKQKIQDDIELYIVENP
jgi:recombination protein RecA